MIIRRLIYLWLALIAVIGLYAGCNAENSNGVLKIGVLPDVSSAPVIAAGLWNLYQVQGVAVEIVRFTNAADRDTALAAGEIDGAVTDVPSSQLLGLTITSRTEFSYKLLASPGGLRGVADLDGRTVALSPNTVIDYFVSGTLRKVGVTGARFETIRQMPVRMEMLLAGKVDAAGLPEPLASEAVSRGAVVLADSGDMDVSVLAFTEEAVRNKRTGIAAFYRTLTGTHERINNAPGEVLRLLSEEGLFPETPGLELPNYHAPEMISERGFYECADWMIERGLLTARPVFEDVTDESFLPDR